MRRLDIGFRGIRHYRVKRCQSFRILRSVFCEGPQGVREVQSLGSHFRASGVEAWGGKFQALRGFRVEGLRITLPGLDFKD